MQIFCENKTMKICMWRFDENKTNIERSTAFKVILGCLLQYRVGCLCNHLLPQFSVDGFQTLRTFSNIMKMCI